MDIAFFQLLTTSLQWQANFDVRTWADFHVAVVVRCQEDRRHMSLPSETPGSASSNLLDFLLRRKWTHKCKNKEKQTLPRLYPVFIYFDGKVSLAVGREQKVFPFLSFMLSELLCLGNIFFSLKPSSVRLCTFAAPWFGQGGEWVLIFGPMLQCWQIF